MKKWIKSFKHALQGLLFMFRHERNAKIEAVLGIIAIVLGFAFGIKQSEWLIIIFCCVIVLSLEAFNTALEKALDRLHPENHPSIGIAKDLAAGAVLIASIGATIAGILIFYPYLLK
jgi:diacylglycerol kinase